MSGVSATGLHVVLGGRRVLDDVSLTAVAGQVLAITGPSGAGKSTLLAVLAGVVAPDSGTVEWDGRRIQLGDPDPTRRAALVLQGYGLLPVLTAHENVELALQLLKVPRAQVIERAAAALTAAGLGPDELPRDRLAEELSGGQMQRVAVARALAVRPRLLLADEPTSELDPATRDVVLAAIRQCALDGATVVLATHDPEVAQTCDSQLALADGRVVM